MSETLIVEMMLMIFLFFVVMIVIDLTSVSKSKVYRQDLSNMYVAGKVRQIAKKDGINLNEEFLEFARITKNKKIDLEALDTTVERELQEKISESNPKKGKAAKPLEE